MTSPLLKLCMIVKDEAAGIAKTLESVRPHIDRWLILDTGSTDGTQDLIRSLLADVPGELHEGPFIDFATTRNAALELAGTDCEYILCLDAEDVLQQGEPIRPFLTEAITNQAEDAYHLMFRMGDTSFRSTRLIRSQAGWRYRGVVHEVLLGPAEQVGTILLPGPTIVHDRAPQSEARTIARWERDLALLLQETAKNPEHGRSVFYLAQTYRCLGRIEEAIETYSRRASLGGWHEEVYFSLWSVAQLSEAIGKPWPEVQQLYLAAHAIAPHRAEPLCAIARYYVKTGMYALGFIFAQRAYQLPYPANDTLFVNASTYTWQAADLLGTTAYYVDGAAELGEQAARQALAARPDDPRLRSNVAFYETRKAAAATASA
jgi:tetratricopeptide (TPR) repeat protein